MPLTAPERVTGVRRYVPGLGSIADGVRHSAAGDSRAALTVWAVVVPQSVDGSDDGDPFLIEVEHTDQHDPEDNGDQRSGHRWCQLP